MSAAADLAFKFATDANGRYMIRHFDRNGIVEHWFPTRMDRSKYLISIGGGPVLGWEDPTDDTNMSNVYGPGKPRP